MTDIIVTVPKDRWSSFVAAQREGAETAHLIYGDRPPLAAGDFLYVVAYGCIRCAIDVHSVSPSRGGHLVRGIFRGGLTAADGIRGFPGWLPATFARGDLLAFPGWQRFGISSFPGHLAHLAPPVPYFAHGKTASEQGGSSV
jgi:hypothetical protein